MTSDTPSRQIRVSLAGVSGWAGSALARGIVEDPDLELASGVARTPAGQSVSEALDGCPSTAPVFATVAEALAQV